MPILPTDIKLLESERMRDTPDGGGRMTGRIIPSGQAGNVFPKVSRVDAVYGRVNLRKIYVAVRTATLDMYAGAHAIITDPPDNERIGCVLFSTGSAFDTRAQARDRIESYVVAGPFSRMRVYGDQLVGQRAILTYQREEEPLPDVGEVFVLSVEAAGHTPAQQYVRVTDVTHEVRTFTDTVGDYRRRIVTLKIGAPLAQTFPGTEPSRYSTDPSPTKLRVTQVADASRYYGIQPLAEAGELGALTLRLASVYAPLVPSTQRETAVSLASIAGAFRTSRSAAAVITRSYPSGVIGSIGTLTYNGVLDRAPLPKSVTFSFLWFTTYYFDDDGAGNLIRRDDPAVKGSIDYVTGAFTLPGVTNTITESYVPAVAVSQPAHTHDIPITLATRGTVYAETLAPLPAPGTLIVDYRALGRWYRLRDNGAGEIVANDPSEGTGSVDYVTGAVILTLGALPDVGSAVLLAWGSPAHYVVRAGQTAIADNRAVFAFHLSQLPAVGASITLSWAADGQPRSATVDAAGQISGDATGTIDPVTGQGRLRLAVLPDRATEIDIAYDYLAPADPQAPPVVRSTTTAGAGTHQLEAGLDPASLRVSIEYEQGLYRYRIAHAGLADGTIVALPGRSNSIRWAGGEVVATYDAVTGVVTWTGNDVIGDRAWWSAGEQKWFTGGAAFSRDADSDHIWSYAFGDTAVAAHLDEIPIDALALELTPTVADPIIPGSVLFRAGGKSYVDRNGTLYTDLDPATGAGLAAGQIDYTSGIATLTYWADGIAAGIAVDACLTTYGEWTAVDAQFRTAGSPIRPASLYVQATTAAGELISGTADQNGVITGTKMRGSVEQTMGVVDVEFGDYTGEAGAWQPIEIMPGTLRYNSVVITNLPLEASILGLDPVRLPMDGRVPIYRPGDLVVVHHTQHTTLPDPVVAGQSYSVDRTGCAVIRLRDADGADVPADRWVADLEAGTVTIAADWTCAGITQPLVVTDRIEHMSLVSDVQINGTVELTVPLPRDFPLAGSYVSSALLYGDLQAYVTNLFDQQTWTGVWSDSLIGSQAAAQYDDINHPIEVLNESAVTERWRVHFTTTTAFAVYGENLGQIATGTTGADLAPLNPVTGEPYFVLRAAGWGGGWAAGNQLRFNTIGGNGPTWIARTILAGATLAGDSFDIEARGDVDAEE